MSSLPRTCIFCGGLPLSKEHIFPRWMHQYIPLTKQGHHSLFENIRVAGTQVRTRKHPGDPKSKTIGCVCRPCNNGWMSEIQNKTKPILSRLIQGESISLDKKSQQLLATWLTMATMVSEQFNFVEPMIAIPRSQVAAFRESQRPPKGWKIWVAPYAGEHENGSWARSTVPVVGPTKAPERNADGRDLPNTQTTTIIVGKFFAHLFSSVHAQVVRKKVPPAPGLIQLWPIVSSPLLWSTSRSLSDEAADAVAEWLPVKGRQKAAALLVHRPRLLGTNTS